MDEELFYFVAAKREDLKFPSLVKAVDDRIYYTHEDALVKARKLNKEYGHDTFRVYTFRGGVIA
jgi:hypothetical protein